MRREGKTPDVPAGGGPCERDGHASTARTHGEEVDDTPTRILVVEDESDAREGLRMLLEASGYVVETAADGVDGLAKLLDGRPDAAVVDIDLPGLNGYEVARRARAAPASRKVRLIALTGYGRDRDRRAAAEAGFDRHLTKPVSFSVLRGALDEGPSGSPAPGSGPSTTASGAKTRAVGCGSGARSATFAAASVDVIEADEAMPSAKALSSAGA